MSRLARIIERGLNKTAPLWPDIRLGYRWVNALSKLLANENNLNRQQIEGKFQQRLIHLLRLKPRFSASFPFVSTFFKVTASYRPHLFACYDPLPGTPEQREPLYLPRTNNDLEHLFGTYRHLERRITGAKIGSEHVVIRDGVRLTAAIASLNAPFTAEQLAAVDPSQWETVRNRVAQKRHKRTLQHRFRRNPKQYLTNLEAQIDQLILLS